MSDVLFDVNKSTLKEGARVRLAKIAGIIMAYPDLKLEIDGFTDNTGTEQYNQQLSEARAETVRQFLTSNGVPSGNVITHGYGEENPIASNDTASGRQQNRRVELVVSGEAIGLNNQGQPGSNAGNMGGTTGNMGAQGNASPSQSQSQTGVGSNSGSQTSTPPQ